MQTTKFRRITIPVPEQFQIEARKERRSMSNLGQIVIERYLASRSTAPQPDKHIRHDTASP